MNDATAGDVDYHDLAASYARRRRPDPRIAARICQALGPAGTVLNVGAGTGSYEPTDRVVVPVEPSAAMRHHRPTGGIPAIDATAEALPFDDASFDAAMAILTVHQWRDLDQGLREIRRVARGPVVLLTFDPEVLPQLWLNDYLPELYGRERGRFPTIKHLRSILGGVVTVDTVPVPQDCTDGFAEAFYGRPEAFLDPDVRRAQSGWTFLAPARIEQAVGQLRADLDDGSWDRRHGHLRSEPTHLGAVRLITAHTEAR